ncbi:MAG: aminoglycoside phosphotransferase family protein [Defluviitaleaceae bacterium]|nr:aminoglycoside phosphotransferase family protein [Defluviitaleaceae bacterium]
MEKVLLSEVNGVFRVGEVVQRPARAWSASVARFLGHLEGYDLPAEKVLSTDENFQISEFAHGEMVHPGVWKDDALYEVGRLLARLHGCAADFGQDDNDIWKPWYLREIGDAHGRIVCHGDIAPWNVITKDGFPKVLVDWDCAGLLDPMVEFARVCWLFVQLHDDDLARLHGLPSAEKRAEQLRIMADAYGLSPSQRKDLIERILEVIICETAHEAIDPGLTFDSEGSLWGFAWRSRSLYWIWRNRDVLGKSLL